jgi:TfoX/Sxy family transcriptional regulator of competence genes
VAYDENLAKRIQQSLEGLHPPGLVWKRMFGGICYLVRGNMACGVYKDKLIVRVGPEKYGEALARPHTAFFDITGRPMKGWVMVEAEGLETDALLEEWIQKGVDFALSLPPK